MHLYRSRAKHTEARQRHDTAMSEDRKSTGRRCARVAGLRTVQALEATLVIMAPRVADRWPTVSSAFTRPAKRTGTVPHMGEALTRWTIHGERLVDDTRKLHLSIASVELPDGVHFEQYVLRMPKAAMMVVLDDAGENVLMMWRHRWILDRWVWELPGGYVDPNEEPAATAAREVEEETGWRPRDVRPLVSTQPMVGSADAENLLFVSLGAEYVGDPTDINEAEKIDWISLASVRDRMAAGEIVGASSQVGLMHVLAFPPR